MTEPPRKSFTDALRATRIVPGVTRADALPLPEMPLHSPPTEDGNSMTETPHGSTCPSCGSGEPDTFIRNGSPYGLTKYERRSGTKRPCMDPWHDLAPSPPDSPDTCPTCDSDSPAHMYGKLWGGAASVPAYCHDPFHASAVVNVAAEDGADGPGVLNPAPPSPDSPDTQEEHRE